MTRIHISHPKYLVPLDTADHKYWEQYSWSAVTSSTTKVEKSGNFAIANFSLLIPNPFYWD